MSTDVGYVAFPVNTFDDERIAMIETLPGADSIIAIWIKMLCLAAEQKNSGVFALNGRPYTMEAFASIFRRPISTILRAFKVLEENGMIEIVNGIVTILDWEKYEYNGPEDMPDFSCRHEHELDIESQKYEQNTRKND